MKFFKKIKDGGLAVLNIEYVKKYFKKFESLEWNMKILLLLGAIGLIVFILGPIHYMFGDTVKLQTESLDRGRTLVKLLAASNQEAFSENQEVLYSTDVVKSEAGVVGAYISDADGMILSPVDFFGRPISDLKNLNSVYLEKSGDDLRVYNLKDGVYFLTYPIFNTEETYKGINKIKKGVAYLRYDTKASLNSGGYRYFGIIKFVLFMFLVMWGAYYLLKRWTLLPISKATELCEEGNANGLTENIAGIKFSEVAGLAKAALKISGQKNISFATQNKTVTGAEILSRIQSFSANDYIVLDSQKMIVSVQGDVEKKFGCTLKAGDHILDSMSDYPHIEELMNIIVEAERDGKTSRQVSLKDYVLKGSFIEEGNDNFFVISAETGR